jgi:hypothetical protein
LLRLATRKRRKIAMHCRSGGVAFFWIIRTRFYEYIVELQQAFAVRPGAQLGIDLREIEPVFSSASLVKKFAQAVNVCTRGTRAFRRHVTFRSDE